MDLSAGLAEADGTGASCGVLFASRISCSLPLLNIFLRRNPTHVSHLWPECETQRRNELLQRYENSILGINDYAANFGVRTLGIDRVIILILWPQLSFEGMPQKASVRASTSQHSTWTLMITHISHSGKPLPPIQRLRPSMATRTRNQASLFRIGQTSLPVGESQILLNRTCA